MVYTEEIARTRWCPHVANYNALGLIVAAISKGPLTLNNFCAASACMMWEWTENKDNPEIETGCGYCGLSVKR